MNKRGYKAKEAGMKYIEAFNKAHQSLQLYKEIEDRQTLYVAFTAWRQADALFVAHANESEKFVGGAWRPSRDSLNRMGGTILAALDPIIDELAQGIKYPASKLKNDKMLAMKECVVSLMLYQFSYSEYKLFRAKSLPDFNITLDAWYELIADKLKINKETVRNYWEKATAKNGKHYGIVINDLKKQRKTLLSKQKSTKKRGQTLVRRQKFSYGKNSSNL